MATFQRKLGIDKYSAEQIAATPWLVEMLRHWRPAGHALPMVEWAGRDGSENDRSRLRPQGLRLAIRDGSANFYCGGQSIAEIKVGRGLSAKIHEQYLTDEHLGRQSHARLDAIEAQVPEWMARILPHQKDEKLLVDDICTLNGTVFDLEIGLPGLHASGGKRRRALRIDFASLEPHLDGWNAVLWEVKFSSDKRMGARAEPKVIDQMRQYADWLEYPGSIEAMHRGCQASCALLTQFHDLASDAGIEVPPLHRAIREIALDPAKLKGIDPKVRLFIDDRAAKTNFRTVHLKKIEDARIPFHLVRSDDDLVLPAGPAA